MFCVIIDIDVQSMSIELESKIKRYSDRLWAQCLSTKFELYSTVHRDS